MHAKASRLQLSDGAAWRRRAECFEALAHPARLRMVELVLAGRYSVGELAECCEVASHVASEHLRLMERCGLLRSEREGRRTFYRVVERRVEILRAILREFV